MNLFRKAVDWYFSNKALPYWCILLLDCVIVAFSTYVGHYIELGGDIFAGHFWSITRGILLGLVLFVISFRAFHTYSGIVRYSSFIDLQRVATASFIATVAFWLLGLAVNGVWPGQRVFLFPDFPVSVVLFAISTLLLWVERVVVKRLYDSFRSDKAIPVAIYGTKTGGISLAKSINVDKEKPYYLNSFISDGVEMKGAYLMGKPVYLNVPGLAESLKEKGVKVLLVSPLKNDVFRDNQQMVDEFLSAGIKVMMMPQAEEWNGREGTLSHNRLHEVAIEDLLPREKIEVDMDAIGALLTGKRILITGAAGSIGSEMVRQVAKYDAAEMILIDQAETPMHDIRLMMQRQYPDIKNETIVTSIANG